MLFFLPLTSFTVCQAHHDFLSFTEFLFLMIWSWMYSSCFCFCFLYVFVSSLWVFLCFCTLTFVRFLLSKIAFFMLSLFILTAIDSQGTLHLALGLIGMHSAAASMCMVTNFSYLLYGVYLLDVSCRVSNLFLSITIY